MNLLNVKINFYIFLNYNDKNHEKSYLYLINKNALKIKINISISSKSTIKC